MWNSDADRNMEKKVTSDGHVFTTFLIQALKFTKNQRELTQDLNNNIKIKLLTICKVSPIFIEPNEQKHVDILEKGF